jgi:2-polyprenyl-3-methyl-5-hydroxy-6-metoxy-1,4-benzoquinol methylase
MNSQNEPTYDQTYTWYLVDMQTAWWKRLLNVQAPYRWLIKRQNLGRTLDIGCGIGRYLTVLNSESVGVDPNESSIMFALNMGLKAYTPDEFLQSDEAKPESFDSFLVAHVAEHLGVDGTVTMLQPYLSLLKRGGRVMLQTPQEIAFGWDSTHVEFIDFEKCRMIAQKLGYVELKAFSFPLPRIFGKIIPHIEFNYICQKPLG